MSLKGKASANEVLKGRINRCNEIIISAYQIAVKNGFKGTEEEWLASLKGVSPKVTMTETDYGYDMKISSELGTVAYPIFHGEKGDKGDPGAVQTVNGVKPDANGNVEITIPDSGQNVTLTTAQINALDGMFRVCAFDDSLGDVDAAYAAFKSAFGITDSGDEEPDEPVVPDEPDEPVVPEVTLTSISAVYSGGSVPVGTAVADLTGIVVTAHYSDGTSEPVTGYTLSGTIAEGSNTVTVSYSGKTTTFTVTGVSDEVSDILYELAEPTTFDGTMSIDTGWNPYKEDQDFTIISKASLPDFTESYGGDNDDRAIAGAYQYISGIYSLMIVVANANVINVEGVATGVLANINSVAITHAKGSGVCSVIILSKDNPDGTYKEKTGEFNYKGTSSFTDTMKIGYNGRQKEYLKGTVEKFVIYSRVLTAEEINAQLV